MKKKFGSSKKPKPNVGKALAAMAGIGSLPPPPDQMGGPPGMPPAPPGPPSAPPPAYSTGGSVARGMGMASRGGSYKAC